MTIESEPPAEPSGERLRELRRAATPRALAWAFAIAVVYVAVVIAGWGFASLIIDEDVLPPGLPLWTGPTAIIASGLVTFFAALSALRHALAWSGANRLDVAVALPASLGAGLAQGVVIALFALASTAEDASRSVVGLVLNHVGSPFGIVAIVASGFTILVGAYVATASRARE